MRASVLFPVMLVSGDQTELEDRVMKTIDSISNWSGKIFSFIAVFVVAIIAYDVAARYIFNSPTIWGLEAQTMLSGIYYVMGGAYTLLIKQHVIIDVLYNRLSTRRKAILDLITSPLLFLYLSILIWAGTRLWWGSFINHETTGSMWSPPVWPLTLSLPVGALLMLLQGLSKFIRDFSAATERTSAAKGGQA
jgi:TRAP-type mannitol/chloroaromatic compound transport system permease small subunit